MLDPSRFSVLTFDCYGTLIDWETGILAALQPILIRHGNQVAEEKILELYASFEATAETGEYRHYRMILEEIVQEFGERFGFRATEVERHSLAESLPVWPPFPDTVPALRALKTRYKLAIISNTDDDLFAGTARRLEVPFDFVITAQQARSYKPSLNNFTLALQKIGEPEEKVLHVAQSLYHDIAPAKSLGLATVWVNRRTGKKGSGATVAGSAVPDLEVPDLKTLAEKLRH